MNTNNECTQLDVLQNFEFSKTPVMACNTHTGEMIALRPCVENLGLNWSGALQAIKRDEELSQLCVSVKAQGADGKKYEMVCLPPAVFQNWLWNLSTTSDKFNFHLWEEYKKGLVMHLLMMLKLSLDEIQKSRSVRQIFDQLKGLNDRKKKREADLSQNQAEGRTIKSDLIQIQSEIDSILGQNFNQLTIPME